MHESTSPETRAGLPFAAAEEIDRLCDAFEDAWLQGTPRPIEECLRAADPTCVPALREELLRLELECRCRRGERPRVEEYHARFPEYAAVLPDWLQEAASAAASDSTGTPLAVAPSTVDRLSTMEPPSPAATASAPGPLPPVLGEYEVLERLGAGGMGEVYRARHRRLGKLVALKVLRQARLGSGQALARFRRETEAVGQLDHPHLVEAHDAGEQDGVAYLVLKLIDGVDLQRLVRERGPLPVPEACELVRQAALGLQHLHERGLVHRDVKPSNLMLTPSPVVTGFQPVKEEPTGGPPVATRGIVKVLDLGLARLRSADGADDLTGAGAFLGTPDYLAPEQIDDAGGVDIRADVYGLGATLFFLLTGKPPFARHKEMLAKLKAHGTETPPDVRALRSDVPEGVAAAVARMLAKRPEDRYATPLAVAAALEPFTAARPPQHRAGEAGSPAAHAPDPTPPVGTSPRRRPALRVRLAIGKWRIGCAVCLAASLLMVVALGTWTWRQVDRVRAVAPPAHPGPPNYHGSVDLLVHRIDADGSDIAVPLSDPRALPLRPGDHFKITAEIDPPAYLYLIWIDEKGEALPLYPWALGQWGTRPAEEKPLADLEIKAPNGNWLKVTGDAAAMETVLMLARPTPLEASDAEVQSWFAGLGPLPVRGEKARVWFQDFDLLRHDPTRGFSYEDDLQKPTSPLGQQELLRRRIGAAAAFSRAISFARLAKKEDK
jgi:serine/threonine protein kinase